MWSQVGNSEDHVGCEGFCKCFGFNQGMIRCEIIYIDIDI